MTADNIQILLLEDDPHDARLVQAELSRDENRRWAVTHVPLLREACDLVQQRHFHVALVDLGLPDSHGLNTFRVLHEADGRLPILILSGGNDDEVAANAVKAGAADYLVKGAAARPLRYALDRWRFESMTAAHSREQFAVASLGQHAIAAVDLDSVLAEAVNLVAQTLDAGSVSLYQCSGALEGLSLRAKVGPACDSVIGLLKGPQAREVEWLNALEPIRLAARPPADAPSPPGEVTSALAFPIACKSKQWGLLVAATTKRRAFLEHEEAFLRTMVQLLSDIIDRKAGEAALRASEAAMAVAQRIAHFGSWELELADGGEIDANPLRWSDEMYRIAGYEPGAVQITNELFFRAVPPEEHALIRDAISKAIEERAQYSVTHRIVRPSGEERVVRELAQLFIDEQSGQPMKMIGTAHDITEQLKAQESIHFQAHMLDQIGQAVIATDLLDRIVYANRFAAELYGWLSSELIGRNLLDVILPPESRLRAVEILQGLDSVSSSSGEILAKRRGGAVFAAWFAASPLRSRTGKLEGVITISTDISAAKAAEQELQRSQSLLRIASRLSRLGAWQVDLPDMIVTWSDEVRAIHEADPTFQPTIEEGFRFFTPESHQRVAAAVRACIDTGEPFDLELQIVTAKGRLLWVRSMGEAVWVNESITRIQGAFQDISEMKAAERSIRQSEERFRLLSKATNDAIYDWSIEADVLWWNEGFESLFGFKREEVEPGLASWVNRIHPDDREAALSGLHAARRSAATSWMAEYWFRRSNGAYAWVLDRGYFIRDSSGKATRMIGGMTDLTEQREAGERIAQQAALLEIAHDAILVKSLDGKISFWNQAAQRIYGWTAEEAIGQNSAELLHRERAKFDEALGLLLQNGEWQGEMLKRAKDGRDLVLQVRWTLVRDRDGRPRSILAINTDVTEKKKFEAQFLRTQRLESIGTLAGGIAHDLNNVLAPILMSLEMLRDEVGSEEGRTLVNMIQNSAQRGADLVRQVLSFARGVEGERVSVNLPRIFSDIQKIGRDTFPKNIDFRVQIEKALWSTLGDPTQLHQVFMNLCVNARDAMPQGGQLTVRIENIELDEVYARLTPDSKSGSYVRVSVADTGAGIPKGIREKIFEPFFTTKEVGRGTGLGLSTALTIVKSHGGFVHVYSEPGKGSTFNVYLPANASPVPEQQPQHEVCALPRGKGELLLLIDDEEAVRCVAQKTLERFGYRVILAANGAEAIAVYAQRQTELSLVITDMAMPIMDGPATIIALRTLDPEVKILGSSGVASNGGVAKALGAGVEDFVAKPYTAETLLKKVHLILHRDPVHH